jgi:hypothetical protein
MIGVAQLKCYDIYNGVCRGYYVDVDTTVIKNYIYFNQVLDPSFQIFLFSVLFMFSFLVGVYVASNS